MDSRKIVNDIVNKRFSKAKDAIREELVNRIVTKVESMGPEVINEKLKLTSKIKLALGIGVGGVAGALGAVTAGKKIAKFFGATSRAARATAKLKKKDDKAAAKKTLADIKAGKKGDKTARKGVQDQLDKLRDKLYAPADKGGPSSEEEEDKIRNTMDKVKQKAIDSGIGWKKKASRGFRKGQEKDAAAKIAKSKTKGIDQIGKTKGKGKGKPTKPTVDKTPKQKIADIRKKIKDIKKEIDSTEDSEQIKDLTSDIEKREKEIKALEKQSPKE